MPEENTSGSGTGVTPQPSPTPVTGTPAAPASVTQQTATLAQEDALKRIADLERSLGNAKEENDRHSKRLSTYEKLEKEREAAAQAAKDAQLSEIERVKKQAADAQQKIQQQQQQLVMAQVKLVAKDKGIINPELIAPVVERKLEYDKDGEPTNLEAVLDELIKGNPYLVKPAEPAPSPAVPTPAIPAMNPGRSSIPGPGANPTGKPTRLSDIEWSR